MLGSRNNLSTVSCCELLCIIALSTFTTRVQAVLPRFLPLSNAAFVRLPFPRTIPTKSQARPFHRLRCTGFMRELPTPVQAIWQAVLMRCAAQLIFLPCSHHKRVQAILPRLHPFRIRFFCRLDGLMPQQFGNLF